MPVRIIFRGLILFRFPDAGEDAGKIVAELISDNAIAPKGASVAGQPHAHHHQSEIQVLTGQGPAAPRPLLQNSKVEITGPTRPAIERSPSYEQFVPKLSEIAAHSGAMRAGPKKGALNDRYLRSTVTINGGLLRARNVVTWDASGFPLDGGPNGVSAARSGELKFLGSDVQGHMANEVVVEILDDDSVEIGGAPEATGQPSLNRRHRAIQAPNPHTSSDSVEILINNFEFQRRKPVPWGIDFQWLFMRLGYPAVDLSGPEYDRFNNAANGYDADLWAEDRTTLLPNGAGAALPFPYLLSNRLTQLSPLNPPKPAAEIDSRPVCVPGEE